MPSLPNLDTMPNVNQTLVYDTVRKMSMLSSIVNYVIDSKFRRSVRLRDWCMSQMANMDLLDIVVKEKWADIANIDQRALAILKYWQDGGKGGLRYVGDHETYGTEEYWATVSEILDKKRDDCDGFANIIYHSCLMAGIPSNRLYIVASDVYGGGHCYVIYVTNRGYEAPLDGCYWTAISLALIPYQDRGEYYHGNMEWWRFGIDGAYVKK